MTRGVTFRAFAPDDVLALDVQPSQRGQLGIYEPVLDLTHGRMLEASGPAWTAVQGERVLCCAGFGEAFGTAHAYCWALLGRGLGGAHFALRRFIAERMAEAPYRRIEAMVRAGCKAEVQWVELLGFEREGLLRAWGPKGEDHLVYALVRGAAEAG